MNLRFPLLLLAVLALSACSKEHEACFTVPDANFVCPGIPVTFENCSNPDDTYTWNFGDGIGIKEYSTQHTYQSIDTVMVYLSSGKGKSQAKDSLELIINLPTGLRVRLLSIPTLAPDGETWDPSGGAPDLRLWIFDEAGSTIYNSDLSNNVTAPADFSLGGTELCRDCSWHILLLDSQSGGSDPDTVWELEADYDSLATQRVHSFTASSGAVLELEFEAR